MTQQIPCANTKVNKALSPEQLNQIIEAILAGKYSWACFLLLRSAGYNPLDYMPYRTYNRLVKENSQISRPSDSETNQLNQGSKSAQTKFNSAPSGKHLGKIKDLAYLEDVSEQYSQVKGGHLNPLPETESFILKDLALVETPLLSFFNKFQETAHLIH